jgi:MFS superfamily sulfate permease-like transporter
MAVSYAFEDYPQARYPFTCASLLILVTGACAYMRLGRFSGERSCVRRIQALLMAMALAVILGAVGKAIIYASPDWPYPHSFAWQSEALHAVLVWAWVMAVVLAPNLLTPHLASPRGRGMPCHGHGTGA